MTNLHINTLQITCFFVALLVLNTVVKLYLNYRQKHHVIAHSAHVPADFSAIISLEQHQKAANYTVEKLKLSNVEVILSGVIFLIWTVFGALDALNFALLHVVPPGILQQLLLVVVFVVINAVISLPISLYNTFSIEQRFGFNKLGARLWWLDFLKTVFLSCLIGIPLLSLILWVMSAVQGWWWLLAWGIWAIFNLLAMLVYPKWIAPLFNKFQPLEDESLKTRVTHLMVRCGMKASGFFVMDGSKRSAHANAYFTGLGAAKRVVFYDTLLKDLNHEEIEAVLAHELGHFKHKHLLKRMLFLFFGALASLFVFHLVSIQSWFYTSLGVPVSFDVNHDGVLLILFMLITPLFTAWLIPIFSQQSRSNEFEADAFAKKETSGQDLANSLLKLYKENASTLTPDPIYAGFYYSHPPASERIARLMEHKK